MDYKDLEKTIGIASAKNAQMKYDSITEEWIHSLYAPDDSLNLPKPLMKKPTKLTLPLTDVQKLKKFDKLQRELEESRDTIVTLRELIQKLKYDLNVSSQAACELKNYQRALETRNNEYRNLAVEFEKTKIESLKLSSQVSELSERNVLAETDVAEEKLKNRIRNGLLKQLRGYFSWRTNENENKVNRHLLTESDIYKILSIIDKILE